MQHEIVQIKKLKLISKINGEGIGLCLKVLPHHSNEGYIKRELIFFADDFTMVTEKEAEWLLDIQKEYKFAEVFED